MLRATPALLLLAVAMPATAQPTGRLSSLDRTTLSRADAVLSGEQDAGELVVEASFYPSQIESDSQIGTLSVSVDLAPFEGHAVLPKLQVTLVLEDREGETLIRREAFSPANKAGAQTWSLNATLELPAEMRDLVVLVEAQEGNLWGGAPAEILDEPAELDQSAAFSIRPGVWSVRGDAIAAQRAPAPSAPSAPALPADSGSTPPPAPGAGSGLPPAVAAPVPIAPTTGPSSVIRLLPPRGKRLSGEVPFEPLLGDISVQKVAYQIDGKTVATKEREPFVARLVLAGRDHPQTVTAIAYDARGLELGRDSLAVNQVTKSFKVKLVEVGNKAPNGDLAVEAQVTLAPGERLDKVELWAGDQLLGRGSAAPLRATVKAAQLASTAFLRAAAALTDGRAVEDVRLLQDGGLVENVEVNLVELYSVVTDRQGHPVKDLAKKDFTVKLDGKKQNLERVAFATEVPLYLGLLVDNSGSMDVLLEDAKQAAAQFLDSVLSPTDRAFLVSFSDRPTLRHRATGNVMELVDSFVGMRAEGSTALYDTILFSLMEFVGSPGRRALVLMTDGSDTQSRLGPNRVIQYARRLGVPVYMIVLGGRRALNGSASMEVTAIAKETGGKVYYPEDVGGLRQAYAEVNDELRSQYLLTFYTEREITPEDRRSVDIDVSRSGLDARLVIKP